MNGNEKAIYIAWSAIALAWIGFVSVFLVDAAQAFYMNGEMAGVDALQSAYVASFTTGVFVLALGVVAFCFISGDL